MEPIHRLLRSAAVDWPIFGSFALLLMALGAASWFNGVGAGWMPFARLRVLFYMLVRLVRHGDRANPKAACTTSRSTSSSAGR